MAPERKLYQDLRRNTSGILWNRIENLAGIGLPDVLGYNTSKHFFTVELKVTRGNSVRFSPHQISFHVTHPDNTFILIRHLGQRSVKLFPGSVVRELVASGYACGLELGASWSAINSLLLGAWSFTSLQLAAWPVACSSWLHRVTVVTAPLIVDLVYDVRSRARPAMIGSSVSDMWHCLCSCPSMLYSPGTCCLGPRPGKSCLLWIQYLSRARK